MPATYRIIVGVDGSEPAQRALMWASHEAAQRCRAGQPATVQAITAWHDEFLAEPMGAAAGILTDPAEQAEQALSTAIEVARTQYPLVTIAGEVVHGHAADVLARASDDADLLVVGNHRLSKLFAAVMGSVAEACVRTSTCPVVVMPAATSSSHTSQPRSLAVAARTAPPAS